MPTTEQPGSGRNHLGAVAGEFGGPTTDQGNVALPGDVESVASGTFEGAVDQIEFKTALRARQQIDHFGKHTTALPARLVHAPRPTHTSGPAPKIGCGAWVHFLPGPD